MKPNVPVLLASWRLLSCANRMSTAFSRQGCKTIPACTSGLVSYPDSRESGYETTSGSRRSLPIAAKAALFDGFWPLPANAGRPSARSINCSAYCSMPRKHCRKRVETAASSVLRSRTRRDRTLARVRTYVATPTAWLPTT